MMYILYGIYDVINCHYEYDGFNFSSNCFHPMLLLANGNTQLPSHVITLWTTVYISGLIYTIKSNI